MLKPSRKINRNDFKTLSFSRFKIKFLRLIFKLILGSVFASLNSENFNKRPLKYHIKRKTYQIYFAVSSSTQR